MQYLNKLFKITSDSSISYTIKMQKLLALGIEIFDLQIGIISEINGDIYTVKHVISPENAIVADTIFSVENSYCIHTLHAQKPVSFHHAALSSIATHPCYLTFGLESYIGAPLEIEGRNYGTLNFSSAAPKNKPFDRSELEFIEILSHWIGNEIAREEKIVLLQNQQKKMELQQHQLESMGKLAGVGGWEVNFVHQTIHWSEVTRLIHEVDSDFIPGLETAINFYKPGENRERIQKLVDNAINNGGNFGGEFEIITHKGQHKWIACQGTAELENGQCTRLLGAFQDITKQVYYREQLEKRQQELESALNARSIFLANMSHEIRTPINGVLGSLQLLATDNLTTKQTEFVSIAKKSAHSLLSLVNDILDFSKIDSNQLTLEHTPFNINELLENCLEVFGFTATKKSIGLIANFSATKNIRIFGDPTRIQQIYTNLISNAIKFTAHGQVTVISNIRPLTDRHSILTVSVEDTGIGITEQHLPSLFSPFKQADLSTTRKFGGTGLGLSISQNLAELMDGKISVASTVGQGSIFTVELEVSIQEVQSPSIKSLSDKEECSDLSHLKILVVEDNEINQLVISEMLKLLNIEHDIADDGVKALEQLNSAAKQNYFYSLILMDCQMPNMDGYQTTSNIRQIESPIASIPIVALTANAMKGDREKCIAAGMDDYLAKPIEQSSLYDILEKFS